MARTKDQARRTRGIEDRIEVELQQPPQKMPRNVPNGYPLFIKDLAHGFKEGLGDKTYTSFFNKDNDSLMKVGSEWWNNELSSWDWKGIYGAKADEARSKLPRAPEKLKRKSKSVQSSIRTRCSPKQLIDVNGSLSERKRNALKKENPFHTLLGLSCPILPRDFVTKLAERFNPNNRTIEFNNGLRCAITEEDFARVLGFPIGDIPVPTECLEVHRDKVDDYFKELNKEAYKGISLSHLKAMVLMEGVEDDVFHRAYMLFALGYLLCPTTKDVVGSRLFPGVVCNTLDTLKTYKWPAFIFDWLVNEIRNYKERESKQRPSHGKGIGGSLFMLMIIYFDRFPMTVDIAKEGVLPIAAWTKKLVDERISIEPEDKPSEELIFSMFPPHNMNTQACIEVYKQRVYHFLQETEKLREVDAELRRRELMNRSPVHGSNVSPKDDDGPSNGKKTPSEAPVDAPVDAHVDAPVDGSPEFSFQEQHGPNIEVQGDYNVVGPEDSDRKVRKVYNRRTKGEAASTDPTQRRGVRRTRSSQSTQAPFLAVPSFKAKKLTPDEKKIWEFLIRKPKESGPTSAVQECIKLVGAKWPLNFEDVHYSFKERGLVSKLVMHTVRDWLMMKELRESPKKKLQPRRHIFVPDFAINLLKHEGDKFNSYMTEKVDLRKNGYDFMKCDFVILPVLVGDGESGHWFCVVISLVDLRTQVLDSLLPTDRSERTATVEKIRNNLFQLIDNGQRVLKHTAEEYEIEYPPVQQQDNCHDCGIYVIKFMELWKGRMSSAELDHETVTDVRRRILISLFTDDLNQKRDSVIQACGLTR